MYFGCSYIIDGGSCIPIIYNYGQLDWLCQGQWREYKQNLQIFIDYIRSNGLEPVFYFGGSVQAAKQDEWLARRQRDLQKVETIFFMLQQNRKPNQQETWFMPPGVPRLTPLLLKYEYDVEVHQSARECDTEISMLAREMGPDKCAGVLSTDTDFMIYDTNGVALLLLDERRSTMTELEIHKCNQCSLAPSLNISVNHLPILACLMGNDTVPFDAVKQFHKTLGIRRQPSYTLYFMELMSKISDLIRFYRPQMTFLSLERKTFGEVNGMLTTGVHVYREALEEERIGIEIHWDMIEYKQRSNVSLNLEKLLFNSGPVEKLSLTLEHPSLTKLKPTFVAFRSVRQRMMGLRGLTSVTEYCICLGRNIDQGEFVEAFPSDIKFDQLSSPSVTSELKWRAFCWIWSFPESLISSLNELPANLQGLSMLLYFINNNVGLKKWEIEVVVRQACQLDSVPGIPQHSDFGLPVPRGINLAALLLRGLQKMITSVLACNFPLDLETVMPWKFFDGRLFQSIYKKLNNGESMPNMDKTGEAMMEIIFA